MAANSGKTARGRGRPFQKGQSGNPKGRPKQTQEQKDALKMIRDLAPLAADKLREIIESPDTKVPDVLRAIEIILDRAYGKAHVVELAANDIEDLYPLAKLLGGPGHE